MCKISYELSWKVKMMIKICVLVYSLHMILCDVAGGFHWRGTRPAVLASASRFLPHCQYPTLPPPTQLAGALTPNGSKPLTYPLSLESLPAKRKHNI